MARGVRLGTGSSEAAKEGGEGKVDPLDPQRLLDELKKLRGYKKDSEVAEELGVTRSWVAQIRMGYREMSAQTKLLLLHALRLDPPRVLLLEWLLPPNTKVALEVWERARKDDTKTGAAPRTAPRVRGVLPPGVGARLQEERLRLGLTKSALASALQTSEKTIYNYEREATSLSVATLGFWAGTGAGATAFRNCSNSASVMSPLAGVAAAAPAVPAAATGLETAYFAGGCFWGIEHWFSLCPGVVEAVSGYMGGTGPGNYEAVCSGTTGHAEAVKVVFDPSKVTYRQLLEGFFMMHDPTQVNRQGPDVGTQYRSAIFCTTPEQLSEAKSEIARQQDKGLLGRRIATEVAQAGTFHTAEAYHQDYVDRTGRACHGINPWPKVLGEAAAGAGSGGGHP